MSTLASPENEPNTGVYETSPGLFEALEISSGREPTKQIITYRAPYLSNKSLGVLTSLTGKWNNEVARLQYKSNEHAGK